MALNVNRSARLPRYPTRGFPGPQAVAPRLLREGPTGLPDYPSRVLREDNGSILREG